MKLLASSVLLLLPLLAAAQGRTRKEELEPLRGLTRFSSNDNSDEEWRGASSSVFVGPQEGLMEADKIVALPGQPEGVSFNQYGGYLTVDPVAGRALFYYFVESPQDASNKPLLLWLSAGTCSAFGSGVFNGIGPFRVQIDGKTLGLNNYAWNQVANVIFLESTAGIGFSYTNTTSDYKMAGAKRNGDDVYTFMINWLERFPQYKDRQFYMAGAGAAGLFIPELAAAILQRNRDALKINLKGIAMGNPIIDFESNEMGFYDYVWAHALISDQTHALISSPSGCNFSSAATSQTEQCAKAQNSTHQVIRDINYDNIYAPSCIPRNSSHYVDCPLFDPYRDNYLNLPDVQHALHANITGLTYPWDICSHIVSSWRASTFNVLPIIKHLIEESLPIWLYSGDLDAVVPITGTRYAINKMGLSIDNPWRPWHTNGEPMQVGGYVEGYKGLTLVTVRGSGYYVAYDAPERALTMITSLFEEKLPPPAET